MQCIRCNHLDSKVVDTIPCGEVIKRRRECLNCHRRFSTREEVTEIKPTVEKFRPPVIKSNWI